MYASAGKKAREMSKLRLNGKEIARKRFMTEI